VVCPGALVGRPGRGEVEPARVQYHRGAEADLENASGYVLAAVPDEQKRQECEHLRPV
jgi:hypothetical protein